MHKDALPRACLLPGPIHYLARIVRKQNLRRLIQKAVLVWQWKQ